MSKKQEPKPEQAAPAAPEQKQEPKPEPVAVLKECKETLSGFLVKNLLLDKPVQQAVKALLKRIEAALK